MKFDQFINGIRSNTFIDNIVLFAVALTPLFGFLEYYNIVTGQARAIAEIATPFYIKGIKDMFFIFIFSLFPLVVLLNNKKKVNLFLVAFLCTVLSSIIVSFIVNEDLVAIFAGLRTFLPISILFYAYLLYSNKKDMLLYKVVEYIFAIQFILAIYELFHGTIFGTRILFGIQMASRLSGTFSTPASFGLFVSLYLLYNIHYEGNRILRCMALILIFLISSTTAIAILFVMGIFSLLEKSKKQVKIVAAIIFLSLIPALYFVVPYFSGRTTDVYIKSGGVRASILINTMLADFPNNMPFGLRFGMNSQTYNMLTRGKMESISMGRYAFVDAMPADSFIAFGVGSIGILPTALFYLIILRYLGRYDKRFAMLFVLYSLTVNIMELFPVNVVFMAIIGMKMRSRDSDSLGGAE